MCSDVVWVIRNFTKYVNGVSYSVEIDNVGVELGEIVGRSGNRVLRRNGDFSKLQKRQ